MKKVYLFLSILLISSIYVSCQQDDITDENAFQETEQLHERKLNVYSQDEIESKFGKASNVTSMLGNRTTQSYGNFTINTDFVHSIEKENFHSLTYMVTYPAEPELYVNLIFFSNDYVHYHPAIYKYNLLPGEITRDVIIPKEKMIPIKIGEEGYLATLAGIPTISNFDTNEPCVRVYEEKIAHKCEAGAHDPGDSTCWYVQQGSSGAGYYTHVLVIDSSDCGEGGGGDSGNPGNPGFPGGGGSGGGGGFVGITDPNNPHYPNPDYQYPDLGGPGGGGWQPEYPVETLPNLPLPGELNVRHFLSDFTNEQFTW